MARDSQRTIVHCAGCALRRKAVFRPLAGRELAAVEQMKSGQPTKPPGTELIPAGSESPRLFMILDGWPFRYVMLADGMRQIIDFLLPGDLVGIQGFYLGRYDYGIRTLTRTTLCVLHGMPMREMLAENRGIADAMAGNFVKDAAVPDVGDRLIL